MKTDRQFTQGQLCTAGMFGLCAVVVHTPADACNAHTFVHEFYPPLVQTIEKHADLVIAGYVTTSDPHARITTFKVEKTYKGEIRKSWTLAWPNRGWPSFNRQSKLVVSHFIILAAKKDIPLVHRPHSTLSKTEFVHSQPLRILQHGCADAYVFDYSQRLDTRLRLAFQPGEQIEKASRDRILRRAFIFGRAITVRSAVGHAYGMFRRLDANKDGMLKPDEIPTLEAATKRHLYRRGFRAEALRNAHRAVQTFDEDGDGAMSREELATAVRSAFALYDRNGDGKADDYEPDTESP